MTNPTANLVVLAILAHAALTAPSRWRTVFAVGCICGAIYSFTTGQLLWP